MESFIEPHADKDMIFLNNKPWGDNLPCSGFYICKVGDSAKESMKRWYGANFPAKNKKHPWEQDALWNMYKSMNIAIVDIWMFKEESGQMLRHIGSHEGFNRTPYFKNVIRANSIKYTENIKYITVVDYDTAGDLS
jgi:hypothetical protein